MSKKVILKPFDLATAKQGATIMTECYNKVRIICYDLNANRKNHPLLVLVTDDGIEYPAYYKIDGTTDYGIAYGNLKIAEEVKEPVRWRDRNERVDGYIVDSCGYTKLSGTFLTISEPPLPEQASVVDAYVKLMQIIEHDARFGGAITAEEWRNPDFIKFTIYRGGRCINKDFGFLSFRYLAFHTAAQRDLFLEENEDLIKKFFML